MCHIPFHFRRGPCRHVFLEFSADGKPLGRVEFELFANVCPRTAENFRVLCVGPHVPEKGKSKVPITAPGPSSDLRSRPCSDSFVLWSSFPFNESQSRKVDVHGI